MLAWPGPHHSFHLSVGLMWLMCVFSFQHSQMSFFHNFSHIRNLRLQSHHSVYFHLVLLIPPPHLCLIFFTSSKPGLIFCPPPESVCGHTVLSHRGSWRSLPSSTATSPRRIWETSGRLVVGRMALSTRWSTNPQGRSWLSRWPADRHTSDRNH